jgi:outer membrane protein with beta-barrel domain
LRKLALLALPVFALLFCCHLAAAQQGDIMFFGGTLLSSNPSGTLLESGNISEKGGTYLGVGGDVVGFKHRLGINIETSWRASQASYLGYETYRPILTDFNALFQPKLGKKVGLDLFGGIGIASTRFYEPYATQCGFTGCINYTTSDHFMEDVGGGLRYYVWHHLFVRPEVHYYHIQNNTDVFSTDNVFRVGASIGYTIGND